MNICVLIGRLTRDPELKYSPNTQNAICNFSIAVDRAYTGKDGQKQTDFFNIVAFGKTAENCANCLDKGKLVGIKGEIQNQQYENEQGEKRYITKIMAQSVQFLSPANSGNNNNNFSDDGYRELQDEDVPF